MNEEEYQELLQRVEENQRSLISHADEEGEFAQTAKQLIDLLERAKQRMVRGRDGE